LSRKDYIKRWSFRKWCNYNFATEVVKLEKKNPKTIIYETRTQEEKFKL